MSNNVLPWIGFNGLILFLLGLDLFVQRKPKKSGIKDALAWSAVWISIALLFNLAIYWYRGPELALQFLAGYLIEKSLSVDNLFVFLLIFSSFRVDPKYQHKVLFWGILGALVLRAAFIFAGIKLLERFHPIMYVFGAFLVYSGLKMAFSSEKKAKDPATRRTTKLIQKVLPFTHEYHEGRFTVRQNGRLLFTPLLLVLIVVELSDLIFAVDSIPAVLAVTPDPFIVYSSNAFAILGLRALYFALSEIIQLVAYLHYGLAAVLTFVGAKMILRDAVEVSTPVTLLVIFVLLSGAVFASRIWPRKRSETA